MRRRSALALLAATAFASPAAARAQTLAPIRVGTLLSDAGSEPYYGRQAGIFARHGLDVQVAQFTGGAEVIAAVLGGSLDIGYSNVISFGAAIEHGIPAVMISPANLFTAKEPDILLMKARGSPLRTGADLTGKTVAVTNLNGLLSISASAWIDKNGGDAKRVRFVELNLAAMATSLQQGRVDAAMLSDPLKTEQRELIEPLGDANAAIAPIFLSGCFIAAKAWASANPDLARRFAAAMLETARWSNANRQLTAQNLTERAKLNAATVATMARASYGEFITAPLLDAPFAAAQKYGVLHAPVDVAAMLAGAKPYSSGLR